MDLNNAPKTYRLGSSEMIFAPNMVRLAIEQFPFDPAWASRLISQGWGVPIAAAEALLSKAVPYTIDDRTVIFTA